MSTGRDMYPRRHKGMTGRCVYYTAMSSEKAMHKKRELVDPIISALSVSSFNKIA